MKQVQILLVEDNEGDILLTQEAFEESKLINALNVVRDGREAVDYLEAVEDKEKLPDIILLDVNLPKKNGHEVLTHIKKSEKLRHIPVIMLTTSSSEKDINLSYRNCANCYITKPINVSDFFGVINKIENFWIQVVKLPHNK